MSLITNTNLNLVLYLRLFEEIHNTYLIALYIDQLKFKILTSRSFSMLDVAQACTIEEVFRYVLEQILTSDVAQINLRHVNDYTMKYTMHEESMKQNYVLLIAVLKNIFRFSIS